MAKVSAWQGATTGGSMCGRVSSCWCHRPCTRIEFFNGRCRAPLLLHCQTRPGWPLVEATVCTKLSPMNNFRAGFAVASSVWLPRNSQARLRAFAVLHCRGAGEVGRWGSPVLKCGRIDAAETVAGCTLAPAEGGARLRPCASSSHLHALTICASIGSIAHDLGACRCWATSQRGIHYANDRCVASRPPTPSRPARSVCYHSVPQSGPPNQPAYSLRRSEARCAQGSFNASSTPVTVLLHF